MNTEEGGGAADEELNALAQYEDLGAIRQAEVATKSVKKTSARQAQYVSTRGFWSKFLLFIRSRLER